MVFQSDRIIIANTANTIPVRFATSEGTTYLFFDWGLLFPIHNRKGKTLSPINIAGWMAIGLQQITT